MIHILWKTAWQLLMKPNILLPHNPAISLLSIYLNQLKTYVHTHVLFIHNCPNLETAKMHFRRWRDKLIMYIQTISDILISTKK